MLAACTYPFLSKKILFIFVVSHAYISNNSGQENGCFFARSRNLFYPPGSHSTLFDKPPVIKWRATILCIQMCGCNPSWHLSCHFFDYIAYLSLKGLQGLKVSPKFSRTISRKVSEKVFNMFRHPHVNKKGEIGRIGWKMLQIRVFWFRTPQISKPQFYFFSFKCGSGLIPINSHLGWGLT